MTNINCSENCYYQKDGKCCFDKVVAQPPPSNSGQVATCAYFRENPHF